MSVHKERNGWRVKWREDDRQRSRSFKAEDEARTFDAEMHPPEPASASPVDHEAKVDLAGAVARRESVPYEVAERWIREGRVVIDDGARSVLKGPTIPAIDVEDILVGKTLTGEQKESMRLRRELRETVAAKRNVPVGSVAVDGTVDPRAHQLPKREES